MHLQDNTHTIRRFLDELSEEQLQTLDIIIANCHSTEQASFWRGRIEGMLDMKYDVCPCGENHNPQELLEDVHLPEPRVTSETPITDAAEAGYTKEEYQKLLVDYALAPVDDHFICTGCGQYYPSLEDRMLRKPGMDGCGGCQQKSAWG